MHELSIAQALAELAASHLRDGMMLRSVRVRAGALRAIDPQAMLGAWEFARGDGACAGAILHLVMSPWSMRCIACGRRWESPENNLPCTCGSSDVHPAGTDELLLESIEVDEVEVTAETRGGEHAGARH